MFRTDDEYVCAIAGVPPVEEAADCIRAAGSERIRPSGTITARHGALTPIIRSATVVTPFDGVGAPGVK